MIFIFDLCNELHLISPLDFLKGDFNTFYFNISLRPLNYSKSEVSIFLFIFFTLMH